MASRLEERSDVSPESISAAARTVPSNLANESYESDASSASPCLESTQPLPLTAQNLHLNSDADVDKSPMSAINNFFDNYFVPDLSSRHLDVIEPLPLPQDSASSCQPLDTSAAMALQLLDKMRERILSRNRVQYFDTSERNTRMDLSFELGQHQQSHQGLSNIHQFLSNNQNQQVCNLGGMNQQHPAETTTPDISVLGIFGSSSPTANFQQQLRMSLARERPLHNLHKTEEDNTANNDLAPIDSLTSISLADKSLLLDMLRGSM